MYQPDKVERAVEFAYFNRECPLNERRVHELVCVALNVLNVPRYSEHAGCRVRDDRTGVEFVWRLV